MAEKKLGEVLLMKTTIDIEGMTCSACSGTIERGIGMLDGVESITISLLLNNGDVVFDANEISAETIAEEIEDLGFDAKVDRVAPLIDRSTANGDAEADSQIKRAIVDISGMTCSACTGTIERGIAMLEGVRQITVSLLLNNAEVVYDSDVISADTIAEEIEDLGFDASVAEIRGTNRTSIAFTIDLFEGDKDDASQLKEVLEKHGCDDVKIDLANSLVTLTYDSVAVGPRQVMRYFSEVNVDAQLSSATGGQKSADKVNQTNRREGRKWRRLFIFSCTFAIPAAVVAMVLPRIEVTHMWLMQPVINDLTRMALILWILVTPVQFGVGWQFYRDAWAGIKHGGFNMSFLVALGTSSAYSYSIMSVVAALSGKVDPATLGNEHFFETSSTLITFICLGKFLESLAKGRTSEALRDLMDLQAQTAVLLEMDDSGRNVVRETEIDIGLVQRGDRLKVIRGSKVPADGVIVQGQCTLDESMITGEAMPVSKKVGSEVTGSTVNNDGEAMPVSKKVGSEVTGSTVNNDGTIHIEVTRVGEETTLSQIVRLMEDAQTSKAPIQRLADRISNVFVPCVITVAILTFLVWLAVALSVYEDNAYMRGQASPFVFALLFGIATVTIACPCALGLATPTAIMVGTGKGAQFGVLIKGGLALETAHRVTSIIFDKTGTLTYGKPSVTDFYLLPECSMSLNDAAFLAGSAELDSEHPLGKAIAEYARERMSEKAAGGDVSKASASQSLSNTTLSSLEASVRGILNARHDVADEIDARDLCQPRDFQSTSGRGLNCVVKGSKVCIGNRAWMHDNEIAVPKHAEDLMQAMERAAKTAICLAVDNTLIACLGLADEIKPESRAVVNWLVEQGISVWMVTGDNRRTAECTFTFCGLVEQGISVWMVTGDNRRTAEVVARHVGIRNVRAEVLPKDKFAAVESLQLDGEVVAVVGDGINDSPALAQADLGIAIGAGTAIAIEAADMVLVQSDLRDVITALALSRVTFNRIRWNFMWALGYNVLGIPLAAGVFWPMFHIRLLPEFAALAMAMSSLCVLTSSLLLKFWKKPNVDIKTYDPESEDTVLLSQNALGNNDVVVAIGDELAPKRPGKSLGANAMLSAISMPHRRRRSSAASDVDPAEHDPSCACLRAKNRCNCKRRRFDGKKYHGLEMSSLAGGDSEDEFGELPNQQESMDSNLLRAVEIDPSADSRCQCGDNCRCGEQGAEATCGSSSSS